MKKIVIRILKGLPVALLLLSLALTFPPPTAVGQPTTTYVKVINPLTGDGNFTFYTNCSHIWTDPEMKPETCLGPAIGYEFIANITVENVIDLCTWQLNITFNPTILNVKDISVPTDHVFAGRPTTVTPKDINNIEGYVVWSYLIGPPAPPDPPSIPFNGSGTMCQIRFNVTAKPDCTTPGEKLSCDIIIDRVCPLLTSFLLNSDVDEIPFTEENGYYEIQYKVPPPPPIPKPYLEAIDPTDGDNLVEIGGGPPIVGTPKALFNVDILIKDVSAELKLIAVQSLMIQYNATLLKIRNVNEGTFMNNSAWAPYGTEFAWFDEIEDDLGNLTLMCIIWSNQTTGEWDWGVFPSGEGVFCTIEFEAIMQEEYPWTAGTVLNMEPLFGEYFLSADIEWIPYETAVDGEYQITGWEIIETFVHTITWEEHAFDVITVSNGSIRPHPMKFEQRWKMLTFNVTTYFEDFNVTGKSGTTRFVNITIPKGLLNAEPNNWLVLAGGYRLILSVVENTTHTSLYFTLTASIKPVQIFGIWVIPEFSTNNLLLIFMAIISITIVWLKKYGNLIRCKILP